MWTECPDPLFDGLVVAGIVGLVFSAILAAKGASDEKSLQALKCQEVVIVAEKRGNILAQCPAGTYIDVLDSDVIVCRCASQNRRSSIELGIPEIVEPPAQADPETDQLADPNDRNNWL